jgi:hypothetical protein
MRTIIIFVHISQEIFVSPKGYVEKIQDEFFREQMIDEFTKVTNYFFWIRHVMTGKTHDWRLSSLGFVGSTMKRLDEVSQMLPNPAE